MAVFNSLYAAAYDLLYADKDYAGEAGFIDGIVKRHAPLATTLLDLGSGTGRHALELMNLGYQVVGVELSAEMLALATQALDGLAAGHAGPQLPEFHLGDVRKVRVGKKFDVVTSLFHVMSYQITNDDLKAAVNTASEHLSSGGIFVFDFWYGPAVLTERPAIRVKRLQGQGIELVRTAEPLVRYNDNIVEVDYEVFVRNQVDDSHGQFKEHHEMRYLFLPEIQEFASSLGWSILETGEWMTGAAPTEKTWGVYTVLRKL
jgi:SAM-dependent methyltransferase